MRPKTANWTAVVVVAMAIAASSMAAFAETVVPQTAADHLALAKKYSDEAAGYRKLAADHKEMAEAYKKSVPCSHSCPTTENYRASHRPCPRRGF
jgi:hypothetical protein